MLYRRACREFQPMSRFAILEHDHPFLHWDFLLEWGGALRTWRLLKLPDSQTVIAAEELPEHRIAYLDYEGPVSRNRGTVKQWDAGNFTWEQREVDCCTLQLQGRILRGIVKLIRKNGKSWEFERLETGRQESLLHGI